MVPRGYTQKMPPRELKNESLTNLAFTIIHEKRILRKKFGVLFLQILEKRNLTKEFVVFNEFGFS